MVDKLKQTSQLLDRASNSTKSVLSLPLDSIVTDPYQVRTLFDEKSLKELSDSLEEHGQIEPIVVSPKSIDGTYVIQKGERRYRAARLAGWSHIEAIINDIDGIGDIALRMQQLAENIQREDLLPTEISESIAVFKEKGLSNKEIARKLAKSEPWVSQHLAIKSAPECVKALITSNKTNDATTINLLAKWHSESPEKCEKYCDDALNSEKGVSRTEVNKLRKNVNSNSSQTVTKQKKKPASEKTLQVRLSGDDRMWTIDLTKSKGSDLVLVAGSEETVASPEQVSIVSVLA
jgi:ParB family chromosome partitioning protein